MSTTVMPGATPDLFEAPADWERWQQSITPSGGSMHRALEPLKRAATSTAPSGSEGGYLEQLVRGGFAVGLVVAAVAVAPTGGAITRVPADLQSAVTAGPVVTPRRREDDTPVDRSPDSAAPSAALATGLTSEATEAATAPAVAPALTAANITAEDQLAAIQEGLSLSVTQLAEILQVARGTVYGWMRGEVELPRDHGTAQRLRDLERIARAWRARSAETIGRLVAALLGDDQPSLIALLAADTWDEPAIDQALAVLAERLEARNQDRRRDRKRGLGRARSVTPETVELERLRLRGLT